MKGSWHISLQNIRKNQILAIKLLFIFPHNIQQRAGHPIHYTPSGGERGKGLPRLRLLKINPYINAQPNR